MAWFIFLFQGHYQKANSAIQTQTYR